MNANADQTSEPYFENVFHVIHPVVEHKNAIQSNLLTYSIQTEHHMECCVCVFFSALLKILVRPVISTIVKLMHTIWRWMRVKVHIHTEFTKFTTQSNIRAYCVEILFAKNSPSKYVSKWVYVRRWRVFFLFGSYVHFTLVSINLNPLLSWTKWKIFDVKENN